MVGVGARAGTEGENTGKGAGAHGEPIRRDGEVGGARWQQIDGGDRRLEMGKMVTKAMTRGLRA